MTHDVIFSHDFDKPDVTFSHPRKLTKTRQSVQKHSNWGLHLPPHPPGQAANVHSPSEALGQVERAGEQHGPYPGAEVAHLLQVTQLGRWGSENKRLSSKLSVHLPSCDIL